MYRVYDELEKLWIKDGIYMSPNGDLYIIDNSSKFIFNKMKLIQLPNNARYTYHKDINLYDKENILVYEGDYVEANVSEDKTVVGLVCYAHELSAYVILCVDSDEFYTLGTEVCNRIKVIGNVFDGYEN